LCPHTPSNSAAASQTELEIRLTTGEAEVKMPKLKKMKARIEY
jgi:hypothetical protein